VLKVVLGGDAKVERLKVLGDSEDAVAPVVGPLGVLDVVDAVVGDDERLVKLVRVVRGAVADEAVVLVPDPRLDARLVRRARVLDVRRLELVGQTLGAVQNDRVAAISFDKNDRISNTVQALTSKRMCVKKKAQSGGRETFRKDIGPLRKTVLESTSYLKVSQ
jgi:hypothetical protein